MQGYMLDEASIQAPIYKAKSLPDPKNIANWVKYDPIIRPNRVIRQISHENEAPPFVQRTKGGMLDIMPLNK